MTRITPYSADYSVVAVMREHAGYDGDDCEQCPAASQCLAIYDQVERRTTVFPCGKRPEKPAWMNTTWRRAELRGVQP